MDHFNFGKIGAQRSPKHPPPCPIVPYLLGSASRPSRAAAPAAAHPALRSGPTCSRGQARAPLPQGSLPGPSLAAAVSSAAASSSPSSPAPGRASPCPPWGQRQPTLRRGLPGARSAVGAQSPLSSQLRRAPLCAPQVLGLRALPGFPRPGFEVSRWKVSALSGPRSDRHRAVTTPVRASLRPVAARGPSALSGPRRLPQCRAL